ncbi:MAG: hypothetical protein AAF597_13965, partial [Bacteroidota bacterium]
DTLYEDVGGPLLYFEENHRIAIRAYFEPNCEVVNNSNGWRGNFFYNSPRFGETYEALNSFTPFRIFKPDNFSFIQSPFESQAFTQETCFELRVTNNDAAQQDFTWLTVVDNPNLNITRVLEESVEVSLNPAGFYELGALPGNTTQSVEICVDLTECSAFDFDVVFKANCSGYPDVFDSGTCEEDVFTYRITPVNAQVQLSITDQPSSQDFLPLCDTFDIAVEFNSANAADLIDPGIIFRPPPGLEIIGVEGEYAGNSGNREAMTLVPRPDGSLFVDITEHSQVTGDSLPGLITTVAPNPRLFQFYLRYVTDCDFQPGARIGFQAVGNSPCGDPAIGTSTQTLSNALNIAGAETYQTSITVTDEPLIGCTSEGNVNVRYTIIGDETTDGDTTLLTLPPGVVFNSFTNVSVAPNTVELVSNETQADGTTEVRFKVPPGLPNFAELEFDFSVTASPSAACSDSLAYSLIHTVTLPPIMCGVDSTCVNAAVVISGQNNQGFVVEKAFVTLDLIEACTFENTYGVDGRI